MMGLPLVPMVIDVEPMIEPSLSMMVLIGRSLSIAPLHVEFLQTTTLRSKLVALRSKFVALV